MMKLALTVLAICLAAANANEVCRAYQGKTLYTFGKTREMVKLPCKYNAVRRTVCGDWLVTITPGNVLEATRYKYVTRTLYVGVENIHDSSKWEGRTTLTVAKKYIDGIKPEPFNKKDGQLSASDVFNYESDPKTVSLVEKNNQFRIDFGLYDVTTHKGPSGFTFTCQSDNAELTPYPQQVCGNGTKREVYRYKKEHGLKANRRATLFLNIFTNPQLIQVDSDCSSAANAMTRKCKGLEQQFEASKLCYPILAKKKYYSHILDSLQNPISTFRHCVEFVCSDYKNLDSCAALGDELDDCPTLPVISAKVKATCDEYLMTNDDPDEEDFNY